MTTENDARAEILALEKKRCEALTSGDVNTLATIVSDDLVHVHGNGQVDGRDAYLDGVATKFIFHSIERGDLNVRVYGDCAVVVGPLEQTVEVRGVDKRNELKSMTSQTWVRRTDGWKQNTCHMHFVTAP